MKSYFADLHIHIGRTEKGSPVKISGSKNLTFYNIAQEASERKGMDIVGIIDCHSPSVQDEIVMYLEKGDMVEVSGGGICYHQTTIMLGCEIEVRDPGMGMAHLLIYLPTLKDMQDFTGWISRHMRNVNLSSQRIYVPARVLQEEVISRGGILIPAHIFTPHKSIYGSCSDRIADLLDLRHVAAVELGLSSDSKMADHISELEPFTFITNSDAHSLAKIGREYNQILLQAPNFSEWTKALARQEGRCVETNYGLNPRLGKYHRTYCTVCETVIDEQQITLMRCHQCGSSKLIRGVWDRIMDIADQDSSMSPKHRPPYHYQVPLEYIPGLGKKKLELLLQIFGTEMNILHHVQADDLVSAVGPEIADYILKSREGTLLTDVGGGGRYGRVST